METISLQEFSANPKSYLDKVAKGLELLIMRKGEAFKLTKVSDGAALPDEEDFYAQLDKALADVEAGRTYKMNADETLTDFLKRVEGTQHV